MVHIHGIWKSRKLKKKFHRQGSPFTIKEKITLHFYKCIEQITLGVRRKNRFLNEFKEKIEFDGRYVHFKS
jgi:hypothetical protein